MPEQKLIIKIHFLGWCAAEAQLITEHCCLHPYPSYCYCSWCEWPLRITETDMILIQIYCFTVGSGRKSCLVCIYQVLHTSHRGLHDKTCKMAKDWKSILCREICQRSKRAADSFAVCTSTSMNINIHTGVSWHCMKNMCIWVPKERIFFSTGKI